MVTGKLELPVLSANCQTRTLISGRTMHLIIQAAYMIIRKMHLMCSFHVADVDSSLGMKLKQSKVSAKLKRKPSNLDETLCKICAEKIL